MAEVANSPNSRAQKGGSRRKKRATKVDMTAMVDVAFLLLTFFVLTSVIHDEFFMDLVQPPDIDVNTPVSEERVLTLILDKSDTVHYYQGITEPVIHQTGYTKDGLRRVIREHLHRHPDFCLEQKRQLGAKQPGCWAPIFLIKPRHDAEYGQVIDVLDELLINNINDYGSYAIDVFTEADSMLLEGDL